MPAGSAPAVTRRPAGSPRAALGGLTTRGRSFLAAGVTAALCSVLLGQPELLRIGLLLAVLPLLCVLVLHRTRHHVTTVRELTPRRVPARVEARVRLRVDNVSRRRTGVLMLQDRVPHVLGPRPRFVLDRLEPGGHREMSYRVRSDLRGRYPLGPLQLRLADPFGMCELTRSCHAQDTLVVLPRVQPLGPVRPPGVDGGEGEGRQRTGPRAGDDDVIPRAYRHGDDLRRVHWPSTARRGELMVRGETESEHLRCTVLLDTRRRGYAGLRSHAAFEWAVDGAASVAVHLLTLGYQVRLVTDTGGTVPTRPSGGERAPADTADLLLDALAAVTHSDGHGLEGAATALQDRRERQGLLVAFLGDLPPEQVQVLARLRHRAEAALAFVATDAPGGPSGRPDGAAVPSVPTAPPRQPLRLLRGAGWTAVPAPPGADLAELWRTAVGGGALCGDAVGPAVAGGA